MRDDGRRIADGLNNEFRASLRVGGAAFSLLGGWGSRLLARQRNVGPPRPDGCVSRAFDHDQDRVRGFKHHFRLVIVRGGGCWWSWDVLSAVDSYLTLCDPLSVNEKCEEIVFLLQETRTP